MLIILCKFHSKLKSLFLVDNPTFLKIGVANNNQVDRNISQMNNNIQVATISQCMWGHTNIK